jgi:hypothetical protein
MLCLYHCKPLSSGKKGGARHCRSRKEINAADKLLLDHRSCIFNLVISLDKNQRLFVITLMACMSI